MFDVLETDFKTACEQPGCPLCRLQSEAERDCVLGILHQHIEDPDVARDFTDSLGYCHLHAWQQVLIENRLSGDYQGTARIYRSILRHNLEGIGELIKSESRRIGTPGLARLRDLLTLLVSPGRRTQPLQYPQGIASRKGCRVCEVGEENLERSIVLFANGGDEEEFLASFSASPGICLDHLRSVIPHIDKSLIRSHLIEAAIKRLELFGRELSAHRETDSIAIGCRPVIEWFLGRRKWVTWTGLRPTSMQEALSGELCPVCALMPEEVSAYIGRLLWTLEHDVTLCEELTRSRGFCNRHGWQVYDVDMAGSNGRTMAMFYFYLLELVTPALRETLRISSMRSAGRAKWWKLPEWMQQERNALSAFASYSGIKSWASCPVCRVEADAERRRVWELVQGFQNPECRSRYSASPGLCLHHLRHALALSNAEGRIVLLAKARDRVTNLLFLLGEYSRRHSGDPHNWITIAGGRKFCDSGCGI